MTKLNLRAQTKFKKVGLIEPQFNPQHATLKTHDITALRLTTIMWTDRHVKSGVKHNKVT